MYKFFIVVTGIYILLIGLFFGFFTVFMLIAPSSKIADDPSFALIGFAMSALISIAMFAIAVGLFLRKNWGRVSLLILSCLSIITGILTILTGIFVLKPNETIPHEAIIFAQVFFGVFFIMIPLFSLLFFNARQVKALFKISIRSSSGSDTNIKDRSAPLGVKVLAVFYFISAFSCCFYLFSPQLKEMPFIINFVWLSGAGLKIYFFIFIVIHVYMAFGLFRLLRSVWNVFMIIQAGSLLLAVFNLVSMNQQCVNRLNGQFQMQGVSVLNLTQYRVIGMVSLFIVAGITYYIYRKKGVFTN